MRTAFETVSERYVGKKHIKTYFGKGQHKEEEIQANVFFSQRLACGDSVQEAKQETEFACQGIQVNTVEQEPISVGLKVFNESWKVWFDYIEEST